MRSVPALVVFAAVASLALPVVADVGPPPSCPAGKHREYLMGHRCVKDGFHLEEDADGNVTEVASKLPTAASASASASVAATASATPEPSSSPSAAATDAAPTASAPAPSDSAAPASSVGPGVPEAPPAQRGCACELPGGPGSVGALAAGLATAGVLLLFGARRRPRHRPRRRS